MRVTIESTTKMVTLNGVPARVWEGTTAAGVPVIVMVTRIAVDRDHDASELQAELQEHACPSPEVASFPGRMIL